MGRRTPTSRAFSWVFAWLAFAAPATLAAPCTAHAQAARDPAAAGAAFSRAREAMKRGEVEVACELFAESVRLDPAPGARLNLAACDERRGRLASASQEFKDALDALPSGDSRIPYAQERIASLAPRVPTLVLRAAPGMPVGAELSRDGQPVSRASLGTPVPVDPRAHEIRVHAAGHVDAVQVVTLAEGETKELVLAPGPLAPAPLAPAPASLGLRPADPGPRVAPPSRALPWTLVATGGAALASGTVLGVLTLDRASTVKAHCDPGCDEAGYEAGQQGKWMSVASPIALGVGAVLAAAGIYLLLDRRAEPASLTKVAW